MVLNWKDRRLCKGGSRSGGGGGGTATTSVAPIQRSAPALPNGVTAVEIAGYDKYSFKVNGESVEMSIGRDFGGVRNVLFTVGNDLGFDRGALTGRSADAAALKLMRIIKYDVAKQPDGTKYVTSAFTPDGFGASRTLAYQKVGFSRPVGGAPGNDQYGIVKNGRLVPDRAKLKAYERERGYRVREILANTRETVRRRKSERTGDFRNSQSLQSMIQDLMASFNDD